MGANKRRVNYFLPIGAIGYKVGARKFSNSKITS